MVRHSLAGRSLRHLRFARRMMVGQPLMARVAHSLSGPLVSDGNRGDAYVVLDGRQLPLGRVLRHLPRYEQWEMTAAVETGQNERLPLPGEGMPPAESLLRLLPRLPESELGFEVGAEHEGESPAADGQSPHAPANAQTEPPRRTGPQRATPPGEMQTTPATPARRPLPKALHAGGEQPAAPPIADEVPPTSPLPPLPPAVAHVGRPRSRIVELPGIVSLPSEDEASGDGPGDEPYHPEPVDERVSIFEDDQPGGQMDGQMDAAAETQTADMKQPPYAPHISEQPVPSKSLEQPSARASGVPPTGPRRRGDKRPSLPQHRASDDLFLPTDADRSPQTWFARLQQAEKAVSEPTPPPEPDSSEPAVSKPEPLELSPKPRARQPLLPPQPAVTPGPAATPVGQHSDDPASRRASRRTRAAQTSVPPESATTPPADGTPARASTAAEPPNEHPTPLPESSRALLHAATGVDPAEVPVYRGPVAGRLASAANADALTNGDAIALGAGHATDSPETLGLLAHELTHVAARRAPRFVPPVARQLPQVSPGQPQPVSPADEESQAAWIEARVTHIASARSAPTGMTQPAPLDKPERDAQPVGRPELPRGWGSLPAPWEPLPDWMTAPDDMPGSAPESPATPQADMRAFTPPPSPPPSQPPSAPGRGPTSDSSGTQRAERGRSLPADSELPRATAAHEGRAPEPDLDALAQQVHAILKRRLAAERRRFG